MANHNRGERLPGEVLAPADIRALLRACNLNARAASSSGEVTPAQGLAAVP